MNKKIVGLLQIAPLTLLIMVVILGSIFAFGWGTFLLIFAGFIVSVIVALSIYLFEQGITKL